MPDSSIRPLHKADLPAVAHIVEQTDMFPAEMLDDMTAPYFANPQGDQRWLVLEQDEVRAVAYHVPEPLTDGTCNLLLIAVDPAAQGRGLGTALMARIESDLAAAATRILLVETSGKDEFARTRAFYARLGYDAEAMIRDYYADGDDKVIFRKRL